MMNSDNIIARYRAAAAKLREMEAAATPGPWYADSDGEYFYTKDGTFWEYQGKQIANSTQLFRCPEDASPSWHNTQIICTSRNLLLPLLDAGDALADWLDCVEDLYPLEVIEQSNCNFQGGYVAAKAALTALVEALEREIPSP
jgi:hypothetical protein